MSDIYLYEPKYNKNADYNVFMAFPECESFSLSSLGYMWLSKILEEQEDFNVERISTAQKAFGFALVGLFSSNLGKTMHCKNCGYKW